MHKLSSSQANAGSLPNCKYLKAQPLRRVIFAKRTQCRKADTTVVRFVIVQSFLNCPTQLAGEVDRAILTGNVDGDSDGTDDMVCHYTDWHGATSIQYGGTEGIDFHRQPVDAINFGEYYFLWRHN